MRLFCRKNHVHKIPRFREGGGVFWVWGGGSADFIFMGARIFLIGRLGGWGWKDDPEDCHRMGAAIPGQSRH